MNIVLLVGGTSPEREVSKMSGKAVYSALKELGHNVSVVDPGYGEKQPHQIDDYFAENKDFIVPDSSNIPLALERPEFNEADLVFIGLHGIWGEDGRLQSLLEMKSLKYTGSGVLASSMGMDKNISKVLFRHFGVPTPKWIAVNSNEKVDKVIINAVSSFGLPMVVKPNDQGSTFGLSICKDECEIFPAVDTAFEFSNSVILEEYIPGRELTVGVINNQPLPPLEIVPKHGLYDYECKYSDGMSDYIVPAKIDEKVKAKMQVSASDAFNALGCKTYARVDFRIKPDNSFYCLEVNTLPGMTSHSLLPMMAEAKGIKFTALVELLVRSSV